MTLEGIVRRLRNVYRVSIQEFDPRPNAREHVQQWRNRGNRNAIFIWIPKCAGNSICKRLEFGGAQGFIDPRAIAKFFRNRGTVTFCHLLLPELLRNGYVRRAFFDSAWKFTFVRNPFTRAVSLFEYLKQVKMLPPSTTFSIFCEYIRHSAYETPGLVNHDWLSQLNPQVVWLRDADGKMMPDFIGKVENITNDFAVVERKLGLEPLDSPFPKLNCSTIRPVRSYYDDQTQAIVAESYREDFELFGYDPAAIPQ